jgi:hypothetical protein
LDLAARAWPFEDLPEGGEPTRLNTPQEFIASRGTGTDAVVIRIGLNGAQLVLVDEQGFWDRWVYRSVEEARRMAQDLGLEASIGEYPENVRVRMNVYRRPDSDFARAAYPEQGRVGPVIPYPENRPPGVGETGPRDRRDGPGAPSSDTS